MWVLASDSDLATPASPALAQGQALYRWGQGLDAAPVVAIRAGRSVTGAAAACVQCHRRSGLGQVEADLLIPPISGNFLVADPSEKRLVNMDPRVSKLFNQAHAPYTEASFAAALREGRHVSGRSLSAVMPRYPFSDADVQALWLYLRQLSAQPSPGADAGVVHLATVVTPDAAADAPRKQVFVDMMQAIVRQKNGSTVPATAQQLRTRHHMTSAAELVLGTERKWDLQVWELHGGAETWQAQLDAHYLAQPVFALVSGLGQGNWQPVADFCNARQVPCWFPSVAAPPMALTDYALYFSKGVGLEAELLAHWLQSHPAPVVQYVRSGSSGSAGAQTLVRAMAGAVAPVVTHWLPADGGLAATALPPAPADAVRVYWLGAADIGQLTAAMPETGATGASPVPHIFFSGILAGGQTLALTPAWRSRSAWLYPYALPQDRLRNLDYFQVWLNSQHLPLRDVAMQSEVFFAMNFLSDTLADMLDNLQRDYLLERAETQISVREGTKAQQETRDRVYLGRQGDLEMKHGAMTMSPGLRIDVAATAAASRVSSGTTMYRNLSLGPGQRFAAKGGYIVRAAEDGSLQPLTPFLVP